MRGTGEVKREVAEGAGNRGGGRCGTAGNGGGKWVDWAAALGAARDTNCALPRVNAIRSLALLSKAVNDLQFGIENACGCPLCIVSHSFFLFARPLFTLRELSPPSRAAASFRSPVWAAQLATCRLGRCKVSQPTHRGMCMRST